MTLIDVTTAYVPALIVAKNAMTTESQIAAAHPGEKVIVVSHGAAAAAGLASLLEHDPRRWARHHQRNTSITELALGATARLLAFDRVDHLA